MKTARLARIEKRLPPLTHARRIILVDQNDPKFLTAIKAGATEAATHGLTIIEFEDSPATGGPDPTKGL